MGAPPAGGAPIDPHAGARPRAGKNKAAASRVAGHSRKHHASRTAGRARKEKPPYRVVRERDRRTVNGC